MQADIAHHDRDRASHKQATQRARGRCRFTLRPVANGTITLFMNDELLVKGTR
jgi:hypothetical protein